MGIINNLELTTCEDYNNCDSESYSCEECENNFKVVYMSSADVVYCPNCGSYLDERKYDYDEDDDVEELEF